MTKWNSENFTKWFTEQLLPNFTGQFSHSDGYPYYHSHLDLESKSSTSSALKAEIQSWLDRKDIHNAPERIKTELITLEKQHKPLTLYCEP